MKHRRRSRPCLTRSQVHHQLKRAACNRACMLSPAAPGQGCCGRCYVELDELAPKVDA